MSRKQRIKHMTPEELKSKLYAHFQKTGSIDNLRAQLRGQLVTELFKVAEPVGNDTFPNSSDLEKCLLPLQVSNWLVYDHLTRQDYQYSLSTFVTEAQLPYPEKTLTAGDILSLLGLGNSTSEYKNISEIYSLKNELGHLHSLLLAIIKSLFNIPSIKNFVSKENHSGDFVQNSASEEKNLVGEALNSAFAENKNSSIFDTSILDNNSEMCKRPNIEKSIYNSPGKSIEESFHEQLQFVKSKSEREVQKLREKLFKEIENLHMKERKMLEENEYIKADLKKEKLMISNEKEKLQEKEKLLEKEINLKFEMKLRDVETEFATKLHLKDKDIETLKEIQQEKEQRLMHLRRELSSEKDGHNLLKRELEEIRQIYKDVQEKYHAALDENTNLIKKFESMSDYSILKDEVSSKSKEVLRLQREISDIHQRSESERKKYVETVRSLEDTLSIKEPQLNQTQNELELVQSNLNTQEKIWNKEKRKLEKELNEFKEVCRAVIQKVEDQEEDIQDLQKTIQTLNYKITNNSFNLRKSESLFHSFKENTHSSHITKKPEVLFTKRNLNSAHDINTYRDSSVDFLCDAKSRLGKLKQEEGKVQERCSYIFSAIPEINNQYEPHLTHASSVSKSNVEHYGVPLSKTGITTSSFPFDNLTKSMTSNVKSPYSLNYVKRLVTNSLFSPPKTTYGTCYNLDTNLGQFGISQNLSSTVNTKFDNANLSDTNHDYTKPNSTFSSLNVGKNALNGEQISISNSKHGSSNEINTASTGETDFQGTENLLVEKSEISQSAQNSALNGDNVTYSKEQDKTFVPQIHETHEIAVASEISNVEPVLDKEYNQIEKDKTENKVENETRPQSAASAVFINLDDAWKRRASQPPVLPLLERKSSAKNLADKSKMFSDSTAVSPNKEVTFIDQATDRTNNAFEYKSSLEQKELPNDFKTSITAENLNTDTGSVPERTSQLDSELNKTILLSPEESLNPDKTIESDLVINKGDSMHQDSLVSMNEKVNSVSSEKNPNTDSLSELSEVHLSCGSEPEEQKDADW